MKGLRVETGVDDRVERGDHRRQPLGQRPCVPLAAPSVVPAPKAAPRHFAQPLSGTAFRAARRANRRDSVAIERLKRKQIPDSL